MDINHNIESPFKLKVSFNKLLSHYETLAKNDDEFISAKAKRVLKTAEAFPELRDGFSDASILKKREKEINSDRSPKDEDQSSPLFISFSQLSVADD